MPATADVLARQHRRRLVLLVAVVVAIAAMTATEPLHRVARTAVAVAEPVIQRHSVAGAVAFVLLSALSAMVVFFSTAIITPVAVEVFGPVTTFFLLWLGWILGGMTAYAIGRFLGPRIVGWFIDPARLRDYERRAGRLARFRHVLLFQLAVPSEIPGYVLGLARCRFRTFAAAMAVGELPFAIGAVYFGESFLQRNYALVLAIGIAGVTLSWLAFRRMSNSSSATPPPDRAGPHASASGSALPS